MIDFKETLDRRIESYETEIKRYFKTDEVPHKSQLQLQSIRNYYLDYHVQGQVTLKEFQHNLPQFSGQHLKVLDFGCGAGGLVSVFQAAGYDTWGVDPDAVSIGMGKNAMTKRGHVANLLDLNSTDLPFESATFDLVLSKSVLEHVEDKRKYVSEAMRVLKPGGVFYIAYNCNKYFYLEHHSLLPMYKCLDGREAAIQREFGFQPYWKITPQSFGEFKALLAETGYRFEIKSGRMIVGASLVARIMNKMVSTLFSIIGLRKFLCSGWIGIVYKD